MRIRLYGRLVDAIGRETEVDALDGSTIAEVRQLLGARYPGAIETLRRSRACVGDRVAADDSRLSASDILEFLPPVSGG